MSTFQGSGTTSLTSRARLPPRQLGSLKSPPLGGRISNPTNSKPKRTIHYLPFAIANSVRSTRGSLKDMEWDQGTLTRCVLLAVLVLQYTSRVV